MERLNIGDTSFYKFTVTDVPELLEQAVREQILVSLKSYIIGYNGRAEFKRIVDMQIMRMHNCQCLYLQNYVEKMVISSLLVTQIPQFITQNDKTNIQLVWKPEYVFGPPGPFNLHDVIIHNYYWSRGPELQAMLSTYLNNISSQPLVQNVETDHVIRMQNLKQD